MLPLPMSLKGLSELDMDTWLFFLQSFGLLTYFNWWVSFAICLLLLVFKHLFSILQFFSTCFFFFYHRFLNVSFSMKNLLILFYMNMPFFAIFFSHGIFFTQQANNYWDCCALIPTDSDKNTNKKTTSQKKRIEAE